MDAARKPSAQLVAEQEAARPDADARLRELEAELAEARETLEAIRRGEVDALVVSDRAGAHRVYTLETADRSYRFLVEQMQEGAVTLGEDGRILYANGRLAGMLGVPPQAVVGQELARFVLPADVPRLRAMLAAAPRTTARAELSLRRADGAAMPVQLSVSPLRDEDPVLLCGVLTDLTDQKLHLKELAEANARLVAEAAERGRVEATLRQAQKMQAIGQLTGGIAHDFNNMLQGISSGVSLMQRRIAEGRREDAERIAGLTQVSVNRAASLTHRLLAFSRRQSLETRRVDLDKALGALAGLLRQTVRPEIEVRLCLHDGCWPVACDPNQLENALLNLAINARDAMAPASGTLTIATAHETLDAAALVGWDAPPGEFVRISVTDTGVGMPPEVIAHAFEPFFTTKPMGQGTGLGLSQVYGFVSQSAGLVRLESALGRGTTVHILLPRDRGTARADGTRPAPGQVRAATGRVLLVDDEPGVRTLVAEALRDMGLEVVEAADAAGGLAAAHAAAQAGAAFEMLITDVGLPGSLNGRQLAEALRERRPGLPVLLITGYAGDVLNAKQLPPHMAVLTKPFDLEVLAARVQAVLREAVG